MTRRKIRVTVLAATLALVLCAGCGKKQWPEPNIEAERFAWTGVRAELRQTCLVVSGELTGNIDNLQAVFVELAKGECPGCPFQPDSRQGYRLPSAMVQRQGNTVTVNVCGLDTGQVWRWRLVGKNKYDVLGEAVSPVGMAVTQ